MTNSAIPAYEGILYTIFQGLRHETRLELASNGVRENAGLAVAFTSANSGEGVTHTIQSLLAGLARDGMTRALVADSACLRSLTIEPSEVKHLCRTLNLAGESNVYGLADSNEFSDGASGPHSWDGSWEYRRDVLHELRGIFDYVLIDCPALRVANDILSVAPFVTGVILVVEANRTRRDQVIQATRSIEFARGRLLGHILNKRRYVVPEWLYRRL
jgi:Mrp family chromosome partitioning ATPase